MQGSIGQVVVQRLYFACPKCGLKLSVNHDDADVAGPCPWCLQVIHAPRPALAAIVGAAYEPAVCPTKTFEVPRLTNHSSRKCRISADLLIDQKYVEWKQTTSLVRLISYAILAASVCVLVAWLLQRWSLQ